MVRCDGCGEMTSNPTYRRGGNFCEKCVDFCTVCHELRTLRDLKASGMCVFCESEGEREWQVRQLRKVKSAKETL